MPTAPATRKKTTSARRLSLVHCHTETCERTWMETAHKVAFASSDMQHVDQHFGAAQGFAIYHVDAEHAALLAAVQFGSAEMDGNEDKLAPKLAALDGCAAVYVQAIGASAIQQLKSRGILAVKVAPNSEIKALLHTLRAQLTQGKAPWARSKNTDPNRFAQMEAEGWCE